VNDTTAPQITCPANVTTVCTSTNGAPAAYAATATDNCDATPTIVCAPASGSTFPFGTTTVTCSASDSAGNTNTCSFTVTVTGSGTPPALTLTPAGANVTICWPQTCATFILEESADLAAWSPVVGVPTLTSGTYCVTVPATTGNKFFRLRQN
jgi:hypothetical protein